MALFPLSTGVSLGTRGFSLTAVGYPELTLDVRHLHWWRLDYPERLQRGPRRWSRISSWVARSGDR